MNESPRWPNIPDPKGGAHLAEGLANEQRLFGQTVARPEAIQGMARTQARLDAGETLRAVYGEPRR